MSDDLHEPTYQLEPFEHEAFYPSKVKDVIERVLKKQLQGKTFSAELGKSMSTDLVNEIRSDLKDLKMTRHKLVVQAMVSKNSGQGVRVSSKCLWDTKTDNWASASYSNENLFAVAMVFGCYYE